MEVGQRARQSLVIFSPYITAAALQKVLDVAPAPTIDVVTTWNSHDIHSGMSDPAIYVIVSERGGHVRLLPRLHMKVVVADFAEMFVGSANLTRAGMGLNDDPNIECGHICQVTSVDATWFKTLLEQAQLVSKEAYEAFLSHLTAYHFHGGHSHCEEFDWSQWRLQKQQLSQLPGTADPDQFIAEWLASRNGVRSSVRSLVSEDATLLGIAGSAVRDAFEARCVVREAYLSLPLVQDFLRFASKERYFGKIRRWVRNRLTDCNTRDHLNDATRRLLTWTLNLRPDLYQLDRPNYSQRLTQRRRIGGQDTEREPY